MAEERPAEGRTYVESSVRSDCFEPAASVALRRMLDFAIFLIVAGPVLWFHLR